jgi:hypothetical protein
VLLLSHDLTTVGTTCDFIVANLVAIGFHWSCRPLNFILLILGVLMQACIVDWI